MQQQTNTRDKGCKGFKTCGPDLTWDYDCGYNTTLDCEECKYGDGKKDPAAKRNQIKRPIT
jgi:hypothetical protein